MVALFWHNTNHVALSPWTGPRFLIHWTFPWYEISTRGWRNGTKILRYASSAANILVVRSHMFLSKVLEIGHFVLEEMSVQSSKEPKLEIRSQNCFFVKNIVWIISLELYRSLISHSSMGSPWVGVSDYQFMDGKIQHFSHPYFLWISF